MKFTQEIRFFDKEDYHFFFLNSYSFDQNILKEAEILEAYIHSDHFYGINFFDFSFEDAATHGPFNINEINSSDFKNYNPSDIKILINDLINEDDWGDDLNDFKKLWDRSSKKINELNLGKGIMYHLNKYWFKSGNVKLWDDFGQYTYFMLFIYISIDEKRIVAFDLGFD